MDDRHSREAAPSTEKLTDCPAFTQWPAVSTVRAPTSVAVQPLTWPTV